MFTFQIREANSAGVCCIIVFKKEALNIQADSISKKFKCKNLNMLVNFSFTLEIKPGKWV